jgi:hypothetical protein
MLTRIGHDCRRDPVLPVDCFLCGTAERGADQERSAKLELAEQGGQVVECDPGGELCPHRRGSTPAQLC